jgi:ankyrin repeat protein
VLRLQQAVQAQNLAAAEALLKAGVDPNAPMMGVLNIAIAHQDLAMLQLLLRYNANPNGHPQDPMPSLVQAAETGNLEIVQRLVECRRRRNPIRLGRRAIHRRILRSLRWACRRGRLAPEQDAGGDACQGTSQARSQKS